MTQPSHLERDRLLDSRVVILGGEVNEESARHAVSQLLVLSLDDPDSDICLLINSPGGSVVSGLAIYDVMQAIPNDVVTVAAGLAASMGQVLLCGGTAGKRFALANAQVLMHEGSAGIGGAAADVEIQAGYLAQTLRQLRAILSEHTGQSPDTIEADLGRDRWFTAAEALDYGFVDHIVTSIDAVVPRPATRRVGMTIGVTR